MNKLRTALTGLALLALSSCASPKKGLITETNYQRSPVYHQTLDNLKGAQLRQVTDNDSKYVLERVVINGNDIYILNNEYKKDGELEFRLTKYEDHKKLIDDKEKKTEITSNNFYVPNKVTRKVDNKEVPAREITLSTTGKFAKKAKIKKYETNELETGIINEEETDILYNIRTIVINGKEFYVPRVENDKINDSDSLPFYIMPINGTKKIINAEGEITLRNEDGFYRPKKISKNDYEARKPLPAPQPIPKTPEIDPSLNDTTGETRNIGSDVKKN